MRLTLMGAGGKMGCRVADNLIQHPEFDVRYVEVSPSGMERLTQRGLSTTPQGEALAHGEAIILALPDALPPGRQIIQARRAILPLVVTFLAHPVVDAHPVQRIHARTARVRTSGRHSISVLLTLNQQCQCGRNENLRQVFIMSA